jgi:hypothetical protein
MEGGGCHTFGPPTVTLLERRLQVSGLGGEEKPAYEAIGARFAFGEIEGE